LRGRECGELLGGAKLEAKRTAVVLSRTHACQRGPTQEPSMPATSRSLPIVR
jgi:hypothetical protein